MFERIKTHTVCAAAALLFVGTQTVRAQIGQHRNDLAVGISGGYVLSSIGFTPKVTQQQHPGFTAGLSMRYTCEKYFNTICAISAELNYVRIGWKERILTADDQPVINATTGLAEAYQRDINYIQVPVFAHLAWGREQRGMQFFFKAGPQFGYMIGESTKTNFSVKEANLKDRANRTCAQDTMGVENKFDYGIAAGLGMEYSLPGAGHLQLEARYYYGLGNIFGDSKRDYFGKSNHSNIVVKMTYLFDITTTRRRK